MNLISNNCVGARIYEVSSMQFNNPFTWCSFDFLDFKKLIINFNNIDFFKPKIQIENYKDRCFSILCEFDYDIKVHYIHYIYDKQQTIKQHPDVKSKTIIQYFTEVYFRRLERMVEQNEQPTFLLTFNYTKKDYKDYDKYLNEFIKLDKNNLYIFIHDCKDTPIKTQTNVIKFSDKIMNLKGVDFCKYTKTLFF